MRHFLVERVGGKLARISVYDNHNRAMSVYEAAERRCPPFTTADQECVLLGADRLSAAIATHGNWFDEPNRLLDELERPASLLAGAPAREHALSGDVKQGAGTSGPLGSSHVSDGDIYRDEDDLNPSPTGEPSSD